MSNCKYCNKSFTELNVSGLGISNHVRWCTDNPKRESYVQSLSDARACITEEDRKRVGTKIKLAWRAEDHAERVRKGFTFLGRHHSPETKNSMSVSKLRLIAEGWSPKAGRCEKIKYNSPISGEFSVDGTWELLFCQWCDRRGIKVDRIGFRFEYTKPNGKKSLYHPDFKIEGYYIEVKGYETELDRCKWAQFPERLIILRKEQIDNLDKYKSLEDLKQFSYGPML